MRTTLSRAERIATMTLLLLFNWPTTLMVGLTAMVLCVLAGGYISVAMLLYVGTILFLDKGAASMARCPGCCVLLCAVVTGIVAGAAEGAAWCRRR
jgi:hypothetical protein